MQKNKVKSKTKGQAGSGFWDYATRSPLVYILFFVLAFLVYGQVLGFFLGKFDEDLLILGNRAILSDLGNIGLAFTRDAFLSNKGVEFYRPLQTVTYFFDTRFFFTTGSVYYFTNLLLHAATCSAFFTLLVLLGKDRRTAFLFTLLFLASPLFVHAIAWAPSRGDLLIGLFGVLSVIFFIRMMNGNNYKYLVLLLVSFAAAMFSKETAIIIPVLLGLWYLLFVPGKKASLVPLLVSFAGFIGVAVFYFYLRGQVVKVAPPAAEFGLLPLLHNLRTVPEYLAKFLVPVFLSPMSGYTLFNTALGLVIFIGLVSLCWYFRKGNWTMFLFGFTWFFAFALPGMMYSHTLGSAAYDYLEHRAYLPMMGIIIILVFLFLGVDNLRMKDRLTAYILVYVAALGVAAFMYTGNYRNPMVFYDQAIESNPVSAMALCNRGLVKGELKDYRGAIEDYDRAITLKPDYSKAFVNKGIALSEMNDKKGAITQYDLAIRYEPGLFQAHYNKANSLSALGMDDEALAEYETAMKLNPTFVAGYNAIGGICFKRRDYDRSIVEFNKAIDFDERNAEAYLNRGKAKFNKNDKQGACDDWRKAKDLGSPEAPNLLGQYCR